MMDRALSLPQGTSSLLAEAKQEVVDNGELIKLVMSGVCHVDSWLIENRILPILQRANARILHLQVATGTGETRSASLIPLSDGSTFARSTSGLWFALDQREATAAIEHIGFRYAPQGRWEDGFLVSLEAPGNPPVPIGPFEVAAIWQEITGTKPSGFEDGLLDEIEAAGLKLIDMFFDTHGQLGL